MVQFFLFCMFVSDLLNMPLYFCYVNWMCITDSMSAYLCLLHVWCRINANPPPPPTQNQTKQGDLDSVLSRSSPVVSSILLKLKKTRRCVYTTLSIPCHCYPTQLCTKRNRVVKILMNYQKGALYMWLLMWRIGRYI